MARKISQLPDAGTISGSEVLPFVQSGTTKKGLLSSLADWILKTHTGFIQAGVGAVARAIQAKLRESISFYDFGAVGDGVADDTAAVLAAIARHLLTGIPLRTGAGVFLVSAQVAFDLSLALRLTGVSIKGAGRRRTIIKSTYTGGVPFLVTSSGGAFFHTIKDIWFQAVNDSGPVLQIGKNDYSDAFNSCTFTGINVNNSSVNPASEGARLNFVLQSDIEIVSNCGGSGNPAYPTAPGNGSAMVIRQVQFSTVRVAGGNANTGLKITGGYTYGNSFPAPDIEEVQYGVKIDSANASRNTFTGGAIVASYCISAEAGAANVFNGTVATAYAGGSIIDGTKNVGVTLVQPGFGVAVNQAQMPDALPGAAASVVARGPDTNIRLNLVSKGNGDVAIITSDGRTLAIFAGNVASSVNFPSLAPGATGSPAQVNAIGADTNVSLYLGPKGSGILRTGLANVPNYANDAAAASGGVPLGGFYRNGSVVMVRAA